MEEQRSKALVRRYAAEVLSGGDLAIVDEIFDPALRGRRKEFARMLRGAFPDLQVSDEELIAEGNTVVARRAIRGTHVGDFVWLPDIGRLTATGRRFEIGEIQILRVKENRIVAARAQWDRLGFLQQLGLIATPVRPL